VNHEGFKAQKQVVGKIGVFKVAFVSGSKRQLPPTTLPPTIPATTTTPLPASIQLEWTEPRVFMSRTIVVSPTDVPTAQPVKTATIGTLFSSLGVGFIDSQMQVLLSLSEIIESLSTNDRNVRNVFFFSNT
jgi:hypothetical protein